MAENKQKFTYLISADTSEAKKLIADLQKSLDRVLKFNFDNFNIAPDLVKASRAAEELSSHLRAATNVNTGLLDLSKFNLSIRNSNSSLTDLISDLAQGGSAGQAAFEQMTAAIARTLVPLRLTNALIKEMATSLKNTIKWELSSAAVHGLESALSGAVNYAKDLNTSLTNIRIVTGQTVEDMARFTKEANAAAKSLSTTTKSYADASLIYYQQGDSQEMAAKKAAITIKAANSSFETTAKEMSEYLTAVWNSYKVGADELERYVDIMAALGAKTATSLEEIATSMQKVAATANTVGVSMEQVSSIISTVSSVTRESAESIGTSYKTIFARIGDLKLGETLDDGVDLGSVSSKLLAIGVSILDANGNMREMGDIITDLGNRWQTMNLAQKTAVALVVAGKRQYTQLMALFENWDMYQNNMNIAQNAEGSLQKMADIYAESWEAASARVRTSFEGIFNSIINDLGLIKLTNFVADFVDGIGSAIDSVGGLNGVLRLTSSILMKTFSKEAGARIKDIGHSVIGAFLDPKKNYQLASNQIKDLLMEINNKKQVDAQIQLIESKNKLLEVEEYLSATQKLAAQVGIADIEAQANKVKELEDAYTELRNSISNVNINRLGAARSSFSDVKETLGEAFTRYSNENITDNLFNSVNLTNDKGLLNVYDALYRSTQMADLGNQSLIAISPENLAQYDNLEQRMSIVRQEAESLRAMMEDLGITIDGMPIEKLKGMLDKTDWDKTDIESLREALAKLSTDGMLNCSLLLAVLNQFFEEISLAGYSALDIERLRAAFDRVSNSSDDLASALRNLAAASENLNLKTDRLNQTLDKLSMSFEKAVETAMDLGSGALDLINGFSAMSDVTAKWGDESLSLADKLGSLLSTVLSLGMAIPSLAKGLAVLIPALAGGPAVAIAAIAALGAGAFGVISGQEKAKKTEYLEKLTKDAEKRANEANLRDEELNNIQTLMKNYNTLRETYISTGEGQDALAASARALADAYGLVGANLLIAEGNFTAFEQMIASSAGLDKISAFYEEQLRMGRQEIADIGNMMNSKYYDQSSLDFAGLYDIGRHNWQAPTYSDILLESLVSSNEDLIGDYHLETIKAAEDALLTLKKTNTLYNELSDLVSDAETKTAATFTSLLDTSKANGLNDKIALDENYQEILMKELYEYFDPEIFNIFQGSFGEYGDEAPSYLLGQFESLLSYDEDGNAYIMENQLDQFRAITRSTKELWLLNFISWGKEQSNLLLEKTNEESSFAKNYDAAIEERERAQREALAGKREVEIAALEEEAAKIADVDNITTNYFDILTNEEGFLSFNDEGIDRYEWLKTFELQKQAALAEYEKIDIALKSGNIEEGSALETLLTKRLENLKSMLEDFNELGDADLSTLILQMMGYEASAEKVRMITETMSKMIGKSEANTTFTDFNSYMNNIQEGIDASAKEYELLLTYLQTDESGNFLIGQDGEYLIKEGYEEKYKVARDKIAAGYISDFTSFDDYLAIYQNIAAVFSEDKFTSAMSYIDALKIKNSREVDTKLLHAMQRDLSNGLEIGATANSVLTFNRLTLAGEKAVEDYQTISSLASSYKENLNLTDAQGLLSVLQQKLDDGTNAWNDFILMDFDQRQAYLLAREESALRAAQSALRLIAEDAMTELEKLYSSSTAFKVAKLESDEFFNTYIRQEDGTYVNKNNNSDIIEAKVGIEKEALRDKVADYESFGLTAENATALANAIELILTQTAGLTTQMQTLVSDFEKFNKTGRVSADIMKKMAEWGIDGSKIKTAQDYLKIMKSISIEAKNNADAKKAEYDDMANGETYDWSNKETQELNAKLYTKWKEWQDLLLIQYDTEEQYNAAYLNYLDLELAKGQLILSQMRERKSLSEEEASKTLQLAESMTAAIQSGNLSEAARVGMDSELLAAWDSAANATERGAVAAQAWNKYAAKMALAGEDLAVLYDDAGKSLDGYINTIKYKTNDIIGFNFADKDKGKNDFIEFISLLVKDPKALAIWNEAFDSLISHTPDISNMSDLNILIAVRDEVIKAGNMTAEEFDKILAGIKDNISSTFELLALNNIDAAQKAADAWLNAFNTIKSARLTLLSGGSILEQIAGNPKLIYQLMQSTSLPAEDIYEMVLTNNRQGLLEKTLSYLDNEDKKTSYLEYLLGSYGLSDNFGRNTYFSGDIESLGYRLDEQGRWVGPNGLSLSDKTNISEYNKEAVLAIQQHLIAQYSQVLKNIDETLDENTAKDLATKIVSGDKEAYSQLTDSAKKFAEALGFSVDALYEFTKLQELAADIAYKGNASNLTKEQIEAEGALVNGQIGTYDEYQKLATAIANAQEAKYNGESWDSLALTDRDLLNKYNINFNNVDTAATDCAKALAACANAAYQLALAAAEDKGYSYDPKTGVYTKDGNKVTEQDDPIVKALEASRLGAENATANISDVSYNTYERMAKSVGMTVDEFKTLKKAIEDADTSLSLAEKDINKITLATAKAEKALQELKDSFNDNIKIIKKADQNSSTYINTMAKMRKLLSDIFDTDEKYITDDFVKNNLKNMEKMAKGTKKEAKAAAEAISDNLVEQIFELEKIKDKEIEVQTDTGPAKMEISSFFTDFMDKYDNLEIGTHINTGPAIDALNTILSTGQMTAKQVSAALAAISWEPTIEWQYFDAQDKMVATSSTLYRVGDTIVSGDGTLTLFTQGMYAIPVIKGTTKKGTGASAPSNRGGKSGGGGGSKKKETKNHKRYQDELERYHKNNETLSRVSEQLDKIEKQKERVYGEKYINRIDEETEALKRQLEAQQALYDEANKYIAADKVDVARYGATFDQDGTIINYEEVMRNIIDEYNRAIDVYNNSDQEDGAKKALEAAEERYNDAVKSIENYEEAILKANEAENNMLETKNKLSAAEVEKITYKLEFKLEMNERDLALLEYYQDKYAELLDKQDDLFASYFDAAAEYELNLNAIGEAYNSLVSKYTAGLITEKDYAELLEELHDKALDNLKSLNEVEENLIDSYTQALELAQEQVEKTTSSIESANETLQSYMDILNLYEGATDYKKMANFYDMMNKNNITNIEVQKKHLDVLLAEEDKFQEKIRNGQELTELEKKEYEALEEQILNTRETLLSTTLEALETIRSTYENTINGIADDLDNFMAGSAGSLSYLQELYELFQEEQEQYVSTTKELYEVSKLNRDIEGSIADATSKASKEALKALQEKINKQSELNQLTEYDLQMNQLEYQLLLARINLEETKNAKDVVRLTRDDNGNYAYRYTANQDKIDEAAQKYEDVLQQINELTVQRISDTEQKLVNAMANYKEKFIEIATDYTLTEEERLMKLEELTNNFSKNMQYIQEQNLIATDNLATNQEMIADYYGASMSEITSSTAGNVNDNIQSMMNKTLEYVEYMNNAIYGKDGWQTAWKEYIAGLGNIKESSGQAYEDMMDNALEMGEMNDFSAEQAENVLNVLEDTLEPLTNLTEAWNAHNAILNNTIETYENLALVILGTLAAIGQIPNTVGAGDAKTTIDGKAYARGGLVDYTGLAWVDGTPDDPELMLNAGDTQNILAAASVASSLDKGILRTLMESVSTTAQAMLGMLSNAYHAIGINPVSSTTLDQQVHITAEFPNVTDHNEIEEALSTLVNRAAQFANHK